MSIFNHFPHRLLALLLCASLSAGIVGCGESSGGGETLPPDTSGTSENTSGSGVPDSVDFGGKTVRILNGQYTDAYSYLINPTEMTGDTVNDIGFERNLAVMERLGVSFDITDMIDHDATPDATDAIRKNTLAGEQEYDVVILSQFNAVQAAMEGCLSDLIDAPYIDIDQPWWAGDFIRDQNVSDKHIYTLNGDFTVGHLNQLDAMYYNKSIFEDYWQDGDLLYREVLDGKWTFDRLYELTSAVAEDLNADSKIDYNDKIGMSFSRSSYNVDHMFFTAGGSIIKKNPEGEWVIDGMTERNVDITKGLYRLLFENPGFVVPDSSKMSLPKKFASDEMLFLTARLAEADQLREMESDYGIIPLPKLDESIENYGTMIHNQSSTFCVPAVTKTSDMACAVMEEMTYEGYTSVVPEYFSVVLKQKYMRDTQNDAMKVIDLLPATIITDLAYTQTYSLNRLGLIVCDCFKKGHSNYASQYASVIDAAEELFVKLISYYEQ